MSEGLFPYAISSFSFSITQPINISSIQVACVNTPYPLSMAGMRSKTIERVSTFFDLSNNPYLSSITKQTPATGLISFNDFDGYYKKLEFDTTMWGILMRSDVASGQPGYLEKPQAFNADSDSNFAWFSNSCACSSDGSVFLVSSYGSETAVVNNVNKTGSCYQTRIIRNNKSIDKQNKIGTLSYKGTSGTLQPNKGLELSGDGTTYYKVDSTNNCIYKNLITFTGDDTDKHTSNVRVTSLATNHNGLYLIFTNISPSDDCGYITIQYKDTSASVIVTNCNVSRDTLNGSTENGTTKNGLSSTVDKGKTRSSLIAASNDLSVVVYVAEEYDGSSLEYKRNVYIGTVSLPTASVPTPSIDWHKQQSGIDTTSVIKSIAISPDGTFAIIGTSTGITYTTSSIIGSSYTPTWTTKTYTGGISISSGGPFDSIKCSNDGRVIIACRCAYLDGTLADNVYYSINYGRSWVSNANSHQHAAVCCSKDGIHLYALISFRAVPDTYTLYRHSVRK